MKVELDERGSQEGTMDRLIHLCEKERPRILTGEI